jgi:hypothetical protein
VLRDNSYFTLSQPHNLESLTDDVARGWSRVIGRLESDPHAWSNTEAQKGLTAKRMEQELRNME